MADEAARPNRLLTAAVAICSGVYVLCCLVALPFVGEMRDFPDTSRLVMKVVLVMFAVAAVLLTVALVHGRRWAAVTAMTVGAVGALLFGFTRLMWKGDPEWADASQAAANVVLLVAVGCAALFIAGLVSAQINRERLHRPALSPR